MSKQAWYVMMTVLIIVGVIVGLGFFLPGAPWRSKSPNEIPLAFPGENVEVSFIKLSLEDFQHLPLDSTYYQISYSDNRIKINAFGVDGNVIYQAYGELVSPVGFDYSYRYSGDTLILPKMVDQGEYLLATALLSCFVAGFIIFIGNITYHN